MTRAELHKTEVEIDQIASEMDWRDPNMEHCWFEWADERLASLIDVLEVSRKKALIRERGLLVIQGGAQ